MLEMKILVCLTGEAESGKSTAAKYLQSRGYVLVKLMSPMKDILRDAGLTEDEIEGALKNRPSDRWVNLSPRQVMASLTPMKRLLLSCGMAESDIERSLDCFPTDPRPAFSPREIMQLLGDWGRSVHSDFWLERWDERAIGLHRVVVDDLRLPRESVYLRSRNPAVWKTQTWRVESSRPGKSKIPNAGHITEQHVASLQVDAVVRNDSTIDAFREILAGQLARLSA